MPSEVALLLYSILPMPTPPQNTNIHEFQSVFTEQVAVMRATAGDVHKSTALSSRQRDEPRGRVSLRLRFPSRQTQTV